MLLCAKRRDPGDLAVELLLRMPQVIGLLHADPQSGTVAAEISGAGESGKK
jgi:hypothetical protein